MKDTGFNNDYLPNFKLPSNINISDNMEESVENANIIVYAVPSKFVSEVIEKVSPLLKNSQSIISVSKGFEENKLLRISEVIKEYAPQCEVGVLSGPSHAEEVAKKIPTACVASSYNEGFLQVIQDVFMTDYFRVYTNKDIIGVELGGALKNPIALACGIIDGVGLGDNTKAALMTRGMAEIARLGIAMGGNEFTFSGLSGIGDLIVTCTSMHSRNRRAGILLGQGKNLDEVLKEVKMVVEGVNNTKSAYKLSQKYNVSMPIITEIYNVLFENKDLKQAVLDLMSRDKTSEQIKDYVFR